jgi:hypothetical protein
MRISKGLALGLVPRGDSCKAVLHLSVTNDFRSQHGNLEQVCDIKSLSPPPELSPPHKSISLLSNVFFWGRT